MPKLSGIALLAALAAQSASAQETKLFAFRAADDGSKVAYAPCGEEDGWQECISYEIGCVRSDGLTSLSMTILGSGEGPDGVDSRKLAKALIDRPWGEASARFLLSGGKIKVDLPIYSLQISTNEMNGDWDLKLDFNNSDLFAKSLSQASVSDAKVEVEGKSFDLAPNRGDGEKLLGLKKACEPSE